MAIFQGKGNEEKVEVSKCQKMVAVRIVVKITHI